MGKLIILNTPIGNLGDVTERMLNAYKNGAFFIAEDTRNFKSLLNKLGISLQGKRIISYHDHSTAAELEHILALLTESDGYLVSDAGSPIISDPAYPLVRAAYQRGIDVDAISGVSSIIMALELAALPTTPFTFLGFLPRDKAKARELLGKAILQGTTHVFFESPKRVQKRVEQLLDMSATIEVVVIRELSKQYQQVQFFTPGSAVNITEKGEFVIVFKAIEENKTTEEIHPAILDYVNGKQSKKELAKLLNKLGGGATKDIYSLL